MTMTEYTLDEKLEGRDLHGLPCRIPEPVGRQKDLLGRNGQVKA